MKNIMNKINNLLNSLLDILYSNNNILILYKNL